MLIQTLLRHAAERPEHPFLTDARDGRRITYGDMAPLVGGLAATLGRLLPRPGSHVVLCADNHWLVHPLVLACAAAGCVLVPVNPRARGEEILRIVGDAKAALYLHETAFPPPEGLATDVARLTLEELRRQADATSCTPPTEAPAVNALMIYTSGTTGACKGVQLTAGNLAADASGIAAFYGLSPQDRLYCVLPCHHMNALMITGLAPFMGGAQVVIDTLFGFRTAKFYLRNLEQWGITTLSLTPSIMAMLMRLQPEPVDLAARGVRHAFCGAAPLAEGLWREFEAHFGIPVHQGYGLTETTCWATCTPPEGEKDYTAVGVPVNCEVRIDSPAPDQPGEILISGPIVTPGYYQRKTPFTDGFFRTGDLGRMNARGELVITGRIKDIIKKNGLNIYPQDIDHILAAHPAVMESATVGLAAPLTGEAIHSACVPRPGAVAPSVAELRAWVTERLSAYMVPDVFHFVRQLPKGETGKVLKPRLRDALSGVTAEAVVAAFDTWKYKRCHPSNREQVVDRMQRHILHWEPVRFVKYWGAGERAGLEPVDRLSLDRVAEIVALIRAVYPPGAEVTLLFTDMHARINGKEESVWRSYFREVAAYAAELEFRTLYTSALWERGEVSLDSLRAQAESPEFQAEFAALPIHDDLRVRAGKHAREPDAEAAARLYYAACCHERSLYRDQFPQHVFLTYNGPVHDLLLPDLPKVYLYSYRSNRSEKPWFMEGGDV